MNVLHTRWRALVLALLLAVSLAVPAAAAEPQAAAADLQTTADTAAAYAAQYGGAQSLQYALWQDGEIVLTGEAGTFSRSENRLMTGDELYGIGSVSKIYTTVAVMQLAEDGKVSLDAPVTQYLPDFKMADERYKDITVRMLLNHSSGILGTGLSDAMLFGEASTRAHDTLLEKLSTQRLAADPGAFSVYCNDGFSLAELVVEAITDMDFMDYVDEHILAPLDLDRTFAPGGDFDANDLAPIYRGTDPRALPQDALNAIGAGGIYATASDLASFGGALTGTELLRQSSLDAMAFPEYSRGLWPDSGEPDSLAYGLGWDNMEWYPFCQSDIQALVKGGDTLYYHAGLVVLPEHDMAAAVVSSGGVSTYDQLAANQILIAALAEEGVTVDQTVKALPAAESAAMPAEQLENAGYYGSTSAQFIRAVKAKYPDQLVMADCDNFENAMLCAEAGADFVGTTMRGYTPETTGINDIDFDFIRKLSAECPAKIIAEGHIHYPEQAVKALEAGAFALVVGGAITRPAEITARFTGAINAAKK